MNELLAAQDEALSRARARASDLAHGLKTPLTVLSTVAHGLGRGDRQEEAADIVAQVEMMRRRIDRQLARARLGMDHLATSRLDVLVDRLAAVMARLPGCDRLDWDIAIEPGFTVMADEVDVAEAVGNVLDNACKWARRKVRVLRGVGAALRRAYRRGRRSRACRRPPRRILARGIAARCGGGRGGARSRHRAGHRHGLWREARALLARLSGASTLA